MRSLAIFFFRAPILLLAPLSAAALVASVEIEGITVPLSGDKTLELRFGESKSISATDEHGRRCVLSSGLLVPFVRDGETLWRLEGASDDNAPLCRNGMTFKIANGRFKRVDHGFENIFKYYATQSCAVFAKDGAGRRLFEQEAQMLHDCFLKRDKWATVKALYDWYIDRPAKKPPLREACTVDLLKHEDLRVICPPSFKKLGEESVFHDVVVIKEGPHQIRGAGGNAGTYIVHPDFKGQIDLRGHSRVFHLPHHQCASPDIFRGCVSVAGLPAF